MDFLSGFPLSQLNRLSQNSHEGAAAESHLDLDLDFDLDFDPNGPEAKLFGRKLLRTLTDAFGRMVFETGFFHGGSKKRDGLAVIHGLALLCSPFDHVALCCCCCCFLSLFPFPQTLTPATFWF